MPANVNSMFYNSEGGKPWHGFGKKVDGALTAAEAIAAAGLDWEVEKRPLYTVTEEGGRILVPNRFAVVRKDTNAPLGVVGKRFKPLQNKVSFSVTDAIVGLKEAHYETAGCLGDGEKVWLLVRLNGDLNANGDDPIRKYLLFANGHGGQLAVTAAITPVRTVCENTLRLAIQQATAVQKLRHTGNIGLKVEQVRETLGLINAAFAEFEVQARTLAHTSVSGKTVKSYLQSLELAAPDQDPKNDAEEKKFARLGELEGFVTALFEGKGKGSDLRSSRGTAWGLYNAVTEFVDHHKNPRVSTNKQDSRTDSILFGAGADLKGKALVNALALAR